ncbi:hypothetical protein Y032_0505g2673 [Ancylostoma ceylanicum]|uniref:Uncharacterized protein n=1 Tax=Ancylostoma ceylanicum TaxID=53326 RepID=A0A016WVQ5_9BILA|nr:hypothetical protein Y032_0505g2673 [Ancylostoma ceylanicum]
MHILNQFIARNRIRKILPAKRSSSLVALTSMELSSRVWKAAVPGLFSVGTGYKKSNVDQQDLRGVVRSSCGGSGRLPSADLEELQYIPYSSSTRAAEIACVQLSNQYFCVEATTLDEFAAG